jgi:hypothetical protein
MPRVKKAPSHPNVIDTAANPLSGIFDWCGERLRDDTRWQYGAPAASNTNFASMQPIVHHCTGSSTSVARIIHRPGVV